MDAIEQKIMRLLKDKDEDITICDIANSLKIDRHTAAKSLEVLKSKGMAESRTVGKSKMWKLSKSPFLSALQNNDDISSNMRSILQHVDGQVNIQDKDRIIWSNSKSDCCKSGNKRCKECSVEKTFKTGKAESSSRNWPERKVRIMTQPIKDSDNNTVAVVEIIKDAKR